MKIASGLLLAGVLIAGGLIAAETKMKLADLPPAVQAAVKAQTRTSPLLGLSKEVEKGKTRYEVETKRNGKTRDIILDETGALVETEDQVDIAGIPDAARIALLKKAGGGVIRKVEKLTQGSAVSYEAAVKTKSGKNVEFAVNADGTPHIE